MEERKMTPQERYDAKNIKRVTMKLNIKYDSDIIAYLNKCGNKQGTLKEAIRLFMSQNPIE